MAGCAQHPTGQQLGSLPPRETGQGAWGGRQAFTVQTAVQSATRRCGFVHKGAIHAQALLRNSAWQQDLDVTLPWQDLRPTVGWVRGGNQHHDTLPCCSLLWDVAILPRGQKWGQDLEHLLGASLARVALGPSLPGISLQRHPQPDVPQRPQVQRRSRPRSAEQPGAHWVPSPGKQSRGRQAEAPSDGQPQCSVALGPAWAEGLDAVRWLAGAGRRRGLQHGCTVPSCPTGQGPEEPVWQAHQHVLLVSMRLRMYDHVLVTRAPCSLSQPLPGFRAGGAVPREGQGWVVLCAPLPAARSCSSSRALIGHSMLPGTAAQYT